MKCGLVVLSSIPVRQDPSDRSEMVNQLLFGEQFEVLKEEEKWIFVRSSHDDYEGWIDRKQYSPLPVGENVSSLLCTGQVVLSHIENTSKQRLSPGSLLYGACHGQIGIDGEVYDILGETGIKEVPDLISVATSFLHTPYLWGGRTIWGIDCSGFTQIVFRLINIHLKRDASQQVKEGIAISISESTEGDLAFFDNKEGRITHVGIVMSDGRIIHASGKVRIDLLDHKGIRLSANGEYSHQLHSLRRVI